MYGKAILDIPANGSIGPSRTEGLSDDMALSFGRIAALTLPDKGDYVKVTLESGEVCGIVTGRLKKLVELYD